MNEEISIPLTHELSVSEQFCYTTIRIESNTGTGTAFYFQFPIDATTFVPMLITNKHVVEGASRGRLLLHLAGPDRKPNGKHLPFEIDRFEAAWRPHPDASLDLCALPMASVLNQAASLGYMPFYIAFESGSTITAAELQDLSALEDIVMIGYPNGIWDSVNNMPVLRRGITATHPRFDYEGRPEFLIDAACFPGSSGSPVVLYNMGSYSTRSGIQFGGRVKLLGVLYAGPQHTAAGELQVVTTPTQQKVVAFSRIPNNLGVVIKATKLDAFRSFFPELVAV